MSQTTPTTTAAGDKKVPPAADAEVKALTAAEAAKKVRRTVTETVDDKFKTKRVPVEAAEVLSFRDYGSHVVVVTRDGQKLSSLDA